MADAEWSCKDVEGSQGWYIMIVDENREAFWLRVLSVSDVARPGAVSRDQLRDLLSGIEEGFDEMFDPADAFNEYVTLSLCRSLRRWLDVESQGHR